MRGRTRQAARLVTLEIDEKDLRRHRPATTPKGRDLLADALEAHRAQLHLFGDYVSNRGLYPRLHGWLRSSQVPVLAVWGRNDEIFAASGAEAFRRDVPNARIELLDGGHFLLESHLDDVVRIIRDWRAGF